MNSIERLSFELTVAALAEQERASSAVRTGAGTVLAAASVAGSFLGSRGAPQRPLDIWASLAVVAFVLCVASAIWVLLPRDLKLSYRGNELIATSEALEVEDVADAYRVVCDWIGLQLELNRSTLDRMSQWLARACLLLAIEVVLWTISLTV